jgi:hypothetical protein
MDGEEVGNVFVRLAEAGDMDGAGVSAAVAAKDYPRTACSTAAFPT